MSGVRAVAVVEVVEDIVAAEAVMLAAAGSEVAVGDTQVQHHEDLVHRNLAPRTPVVSHDTVLPNFALVSHVASVVMVEAVVNDA